MPRDRFDLARFVTAQDACWSDVLDELRQGQKQSHWMWFIFPQLRGLGSSRTAGYYALSGLEEARAYLAHPVLGPRLRECVTLILSHKGRTAEEMFGFPDHVKLHSSVTLFAVAAPDEALFQAVLEAFFGGLRDPATLRLLAGRDGAI